MQKQLKTIMSFLVLLQLPGCGTWGGNPPKTETPTPSANFALVGLKLAKQTSSSFDVLSTSGEVLGHVNLTTHQHVMRDVSIYQTSKPASAPFAGPYLVDLINGTVDPTPVATNFATGAYENIAFSFDIAQKGQFATLKDDDVMIGNSSHLAGTVEFMGATLPFDSVMPMQQSLEFHAKVPSGSSNVILAVENQKLVFGFHPEQWFIDTDYSKFTDQQAFIQMIIDGIRQYGTLEVEK